MDLIGLAKSGTKLWLCIYEQDSSSRLPCMTRNTSLNHHDLRIIGPFSSYNPSTHLIASSYVILLSTNLSVSGELTRRALMPVFQHDY